MAAIDIFGKKILIVGNGMTGFRFCQKLVEKSLNHSFTITIIGEEPHVAYDRVHLTDYYTGTPLHEMEMAPRSWYEENKINLITGISVSSINKDEKKVVVFAN